MSAVGIVITGLIELADGRTVVEWEIEMRDQRRDPNRTTLESRSARRTAERKERQVGSAERVRCLPRTRSVKEIEHSEFRVG